MQVSRKVKHSIAAGQPCKHFGMFRQNQAYFFFHSNWCVQWKFPYVYWPMAILVFYQTLLMVFLGRIGMSLIISIGYQLLQWTRIPGNNVHDGCQILSKNINMLSKKTRIDILREL